MLRRNSELLQPEASLKASPDPSDMKFIDCALAAGADFIVTDNKRHFPDAPYGSARVVSAGELLERITLEL